MKEKYFRYSLITLILLLGFLIVSELWSFVNGLLAAFTVYVIVRRQMIYFVEKRKMNKTLSAIIILLEVFACVFIPFYLIVWLVVNRVQQINLDVSQFVSTIQQFITMVHERINYNILSAGNIETLTGLLTRTVQFFINQIGGIGVAIVVMLFLLFFMLKSYNAMERYVYELMPFTDENRRTVMSELNKMVRSNAVGIPFIALFQGLIAMFGYWIAGAPSPILLGVVTAAVSIIPLLGTGLVWVPTVIYLALVGKWIAAVGLAIYCLVILINIDYVIRLILQKKLADTHPLITVFGVILGLRVFGFWGIIFGPLILAMFFLLVNIFKKEYFISEPNN